jgi:regulator of sigma D
VPNEVDVLGNQTPPKKNEYITLHRGIKELRKRKIIDDRLYDWSHQLRAFRNLAAHAQDEVTISREDAEDLQTFVYAIVEYVYDLTDRYDEFKARISTRKKK